MSFHRGSNIVTSGLVLGIDGDTNSRFNKGEPTTNLCKYTTDFNWSKSGITITNNVIKAPDGTQTGSIWTCTNSTNHQLYQAHNSSGIYRTFSIYVKKSTYPACYLGGYNNGYVVYFDLNNGTITSTVGTGVIGGISSVGNGWYRISIYMPSLAVEFHVGFLDTVYNGTTTSFWTISTAIGTSGYIWGPQLEEKTYPTKYLPNSTNSNITRTVTQSLIDLKKTYTFDVTNLSFSSNSKPSFNGVSNYLDFTAPNLTTVTTVEMVAKLGSGFTGKMLFGWFAYDVWCGGGALGYNTGNGDLFGLSQSDVTTLNLSGKWVHYIFEMYSDVSYSNNKIYINGVSKTLSQIQGSEYSTSRNFNSGLGRIGCWKKDTNYLMPMDCYVFKVYNKALSTTEISQNYKNYKKRFNL